MRLSELFLSFAGARKLPNPKISTTLIAWIVGLALAYALGAQSLFTLAFAFFIIAIFEISKFEKSNEEDVYSWIVIDKAVGVWVALSVSLTALRWLPASLLNLWLLVLGALIAYLVMILWAPSTIGWIGKNIKGALGIMLDDVLAGFAAGLVVLLSAKVALSLLSG